MSTVKECFEDAPRTVFLRCESCEPNISEDLKAYKEELESYGVLVYLVPTGPDMKCVLKSQMIRLFAYTLPFINDEDIIITGKTI